MAALDPLFNFDKVYCFEPVPSLADAIRKRIQSPKVKVICSALADRDGTSNLYRAGSLAGSLFSDSPEYGEHLGTIKIQLTRASRFLAETINEADFVRMKFNCEGSEVVVIRDLIDHGQSRLLDGALVDFDAEKIHSLSGVADKLRTEIKNQGIRIFEPPEVQHGMITNFGGVRNWLLRSGAKVESYRTLIMSALFNLHLLITEPRVNGYHKMRILKWLHLFQPN